MTDAELRAKYPNRAEWFYAQMLQAHNEPRRQPQPAAAPPRNEVTPAAVNIPTPPPKRTERPPVAIFAKPLKAERPHYFGAYVPVLIRSEANARFDWRVKMRKVKAQRDAVHLYLMDLRGRPKPEAIALIRHGRKELDCDNLPNAFKAVRDEIASMLGFGDRDPSVLWTYEQAFEGVIGFSVGIIWPPGVCPCCGRLPTETMDRPALSAFGPDKPADAGDKE